MGPELIGRTDRRGARWRLSPIRSAAMCASLATATRRAPATPTRSRRCRSRARPTLAGQPLAARAAIVAAGPLANLVMAVVILSGLAYVYGDRILSPRVDAVVAGSPAEQAGFAPGDIVESINGRTVASFDDIVDIVTLRAGEALSVVVERDGRPLTLTATPTLTTIDTPMGPERAGRPRPCGECD